MDLYDSFLKVTFDPDGDPVVLLDFGDAMWGPIVIDGSQLQQVQGFVRAVGVKAFPRGNESHTIAFDKCQVMDTMPDAFASRMNGMIALPRGMADVLIELQDGRGWLYSNCSIGSWPGGQEERLTREGIRITGGEVTFIPAPEPEP